MIPTNRLYYGDNLDFLRNQDDFPSESIDMVYLDPPFNSNQNYNALLKDTDGTRETVKAKAFKDIWKWDDLSAKTQYEINNIDYTPKPLIALINMLESFLGHSAMYAYLIYIAVRLIELHRILKPTGSLYLHCDPTASHYLKLFLDAVFGAKNFQNEIIWSYKSGGSTSKRFARKHDVLLFYAKDINKCRFNPQREKSYNRGLKPYRFKNVEEFEDDTGWFTMVNMKDVWQIDMVGRTSSERLGYPTQKPLALLKRIIQASSSAGDIILDPFCGCGTTIDAVEILNRENPDIPARRWIGIDNALLAIELTKQRLANLCQFTVVDSTV
ncbi:MAG: site-specific DNA-methyltransferase [Candidatus Hatepunaea meridiana]|nr:site-specific DNA-methyltransferase [Candidatus Hatepunaea meridiana]